MKAPLGLLLAVAVLAGCASPSSGTVAAPSATSAGPSETTPAVPGPTIRFPTRRPGSTSSEPPTDGFKPVVVRGSVHVSGGCVSLVSGGVTWTLLGPAA